MAKAGALMGRPLDSAAESHMLDALTSGQLNQWVQNFTANTGQPLADEKEGAKKSLRANSGKIVLSPSVIVIDPKSLTATLRTVNPSNDSIPLDFVIQYAPPQSSHSAPLRATTASAQWSLVSWVHDVPKDVVLAPHETRNVTMHITVPDGATPGKYSAHVIVYYMAPVKIDASTDLSGDGLSFLADTTANGFPASRYVLGQLTYTLGKQGNPKQPIKR